MAGRIANAEAKHVGKRARLLTCDCVAFYTKRSQCQVFVIQNDRSFHDVASQPQIPERSVSWGPVL